MSPRLPIQAAFGASAPALANSQRWFDDWQTAHPGQAFHGKGLWNSLLSAPLVGDVLGGAQEVFTRPGDIVNHPDQYFGKAAAGAAPFLGAEIGPWAKVMGAGGHALESGAWKNPLSLVPAAASLAGGMVGGDIGKGLNYAGTAMKVGNAIAGGGGRVAGQPMPGTMGPLSNPRMGRAYDPNSGGMNWGAAAYPTSAITDAPGYGSGETAMTANGGGNFNPLGFIGGPNTMNQVAGIVGLSGVGQPKYQDSGNMDKALAYGNTLGDAGKTLLNKGMGGPPSLDKMGALSYMPGVMGQQAENVGVANPFTGEGGSTDPYALMPHEQAAFNTTADMVNQGRESNIASLRQRLANSGITDPRAMAAAEAMINTGHDQMLADTHSNLMNQAFQNRQQTLNQFGQIIPGLYQAQNQSEQQALGHAQTMIHAPMSAYETAARQAIDQNRYAANQAGANARLLFPTPRPGIPGMPGGAGAGAFPGSNSAPQGGYGPGYDDQGYPLDYSNGGLSMGVPGQDYSPLDSSGLPFDPSQMDYGFDPYSMDTGGYF